MASALCIHNVFHPNGPVFGVGTLCTCSGFTSRSSLFPCHLDCLPNSSFYLPVTGLNTNAVVTVMYVVVIFYTTIGGMKAVVWTDCFQVLILYSSMLAVLIKGTLDIGGISTVWERNLKTGRSDFFNWDFDPTERYTLWASFIGAGVLHISVYGANQLQVQRYRTVATVGQARKMMWINTFGWTIVVVLTVYAGMLIFARYYDCDPLASGILSKPDQLFPLYVMDTLGDYVGFPGLFVAGIFSAGLSTVSTGLNSLAAIWWAEMNGTSLKQCALVRKSGGLSVKFLAFAFGLLSYALVYVVPYMGGLAPVAISLSSFFSGSFLGLFILGIFVPWANTAGAAAGLTVGIFGVGWLTVGGQIMSDKGQAIFTPLPVSTAGCSINATILDGPSKPSPDNLNMRASQGACKLLFKEATIEEKSAEVSTEGETPLMSSTTRDL
ncbi:hypothetical protein C0J52_13378 [Blattella germanica]|nr:hypothetical protein C0J52_13378 [Blattella germanica]